MGKIKTFLATGTVTIIPLALTVYVLQFFFKIAISFGGAVSQPLEQFVDDANFPGFKLLTSIVGIIIVIISLIIIGFFARNVFFSRIVNWMESIFKKIPLIGIVYSTSRQIMESISGGSNKESFKKVIYIQYPRKGVWTLGFVTSESSNKQGESFYHLFIPTTPNPTSGFFLIVPKEDVTQSDISVEEGFRMIVSSGMVGSNQNQIIKD
jgi:uncharacterized membrane protein